MYKVGFLGPEGSFSEEALVPFLAESPDFEPLTAKTVAYCSIPQLLLACERREIDWALVPLENSTEGQVSATMDTLALTENLCIYREVIHPIVQCLLTPRPLDPRHIERVYSHAQALGQCREFLAAQIPQAQQVICASTSEAARSIVSITENWAAIAPKRAASLYQLHCQLESIQDQAYNETRFVLVGRQPAELSGNDKTSLIVKTTDKPGALYLVLREFAKRQINLTRIESRPSKQRLGEYIFFIDLEGHVLSPTVQEVLEALAEMRIELKLLGSYPKGNTVRQVTKHKSMQETV